MPRGTLGSTVAIGQRHKRVVLQNPGPPMPDGSGGWLETWTDVGPPVDVRIEPASAAALERVTAGAAVLASATHILTLPYRASVTTKSRVLVDGRVLHVTSVRDPEERHIDLILVCEEKVT